MTNTNDTISRRTSAAGKPAGPDAPQHAAAGIGMPCSTVVIGAAPPEDRKEVLRKMIAITQAAIKRLRRAH